MLSQKTKNYIEWTEVQSKLEAALQGKEHFIEEIKTTDPKTTEFQDLQKQARDYLSLASNSALEKYKQLSPGITERIEETELLVQMINATFASRLSFYGSLEGKIDTQMSAWEKDYDENKIPNIFANCSEYSGAQHLDQLLATPNPATTLPIPTLKINQFYCDLANLAFILDPQQLDKYKNDYAQAATERELKAVKKRIEKEFWSSSEEVRTKLRKKYGKGFFKKNYPKIIDADPHSRYTSLYQEMREIIDGETESFLKTKRQIDAEREILKKEEEQFSQREAELDPDYLRQILEPVREEKEFSDLGTIYLSINTNGYSRERKALQELKEEKKEKVLLLMREKLRELKTEISSYHCLHLPKDEDWRRQKEDLSKIKTCWEMLPNSDAERNIRYGVEGMEEMENSLEQLMGMYFEREKLPLEMWKSEKQQTPYQAVVMFAYQAAKVAQNDELKDFCELVSGQQGPATFEDRIAQAKEVNLKDLTGVNNLIYTHLKGGIDSLDI